MINLINRPLLRFASLSRNLAFGFSLPKHEVL